MLNFTRIIALGAAILFGAPMAQAVEKPQEWELINPSGVIKLAQLEPSARIGDFAGKTVSLRWNGKNTGDIVLERIAELLQQTDPDVTVKKTWIEHPELNTVSGNQNLSQEFVKIVAADKPDLVIAAQGD